MKEIKAFKIGDKIPENAKHVDSYFAQDGDILFYYEIPIKESDKSGRFYDKILHDAIIKEVVNYLNEKTGSSYRSTSDKTRKLIQARINDGHRAEHFKAVIDKKCKEWLNDPKMSQYLRPETLFSPKFESYLNQKTPQNMAQEAFDELDRLMES